MKPSVPDNEAERLEALRSLEILDTAAEPAFDDIARLAAQICGTPIAQVNLIDDRRQFAKASVGLPAGEAPREHSFCAHTILQDGPLLVEDARRDARFADNPFVTGPPGVVFYGGTPLRTPEGLPLGTLCVVDHVPGTLSGGQREALAALGRQVEAQLELRRLLRDRGRQLEQVRRQEADLRRAQQELEQRIAERTSELERQRQLLEAVLDNVQAGIVACDAAGRLTVFNKATAAFHRRSVETLPPERWAEHYGLFQADGVTPMRTEQIPLYRAFQGETFTNVEMVVRAGGAEPRTLLASGKPMVGPGGARLGAVVAMHDISERKLASEERAREQQFLQAVLDNAEAGIVACDAEGRITLFNRALARFHGLERPPATIEEWSRGLSDGVEIGGVRVRAEETPIFRAMRGETFRDLELVFPSADAERRVVLASGQPILDGDGRKIGAVVVRHEVTGLKEAEEALRRQREALHQNEKLAAMGQLLAGVAHELNNPLSVVVGYVDLLRRALGEGPHAARLEKMGEAAERCARIVRNFLALARQQSPERSRVSLNATIEETVELVAYPLRTDGIELSLSLAPDLPALWADRHQLQQVLINLLTNAHHALRQWPHPRRISVASRRDASGGRIVVEVKDSGPGIAPELRRRIFEPFFTTKPEGLGTGLGLSLCHGIVESHGGTLSLESQPGRGATFQVALPIVVPPRQDAPPPATAAPERPLSVLVVDDEEDVRDAVGELLRRDGHAVEVAGSGAAALERLAGGGFDVVLSDVRMPDLDGVRLLKEATRRWPGSERRFAFLTGDLLTPQTLEFLERSGVVHFAKPFRPQHLRRALTAVVARSSGAAPAPGGNGEAH